MPYFIINTNGIYPVEYNSYEQAGADCEPGEYVYIADSIDILEKFLEEACQEEDSVDLY